MKERKEREEADEKGTGRMFDSIACRYDFLNLEKKGSKGNIEALHKSPYNRCGIRHG